MSAYQHGGNAEAVARQLGLAELSAKIIDFSVNVNPLGPPPAVTQLLLGAKASISRYPEEYADAAVAALAKHHDLLPEQVIVGNGSTELFGWALQALRPAVAGCVSPCYAGYAEACRANGISLRTVASLPSESGFIFDCMPDLPEDIDIMFLASPNNPTGRMIEKELLYQLADANPGCIFVLDLSFADFIPGGHFPDSLPDNVIGVKSLTKFFCIPGLRLGMAWGAIPLIEKIRRVRLPWTVNSLSQTLATRLYTDIDYIARTKSATTELRSNLVGILQRFDGLAPVPSDANFLLVHLPARLPAQQLQRSLLSKGILIRSCADFAGLGPHYCRLAVRPRDEQEALARALGEILEGPSPPHGLTKKNPPAIMVVGTTSNAGKSVVAAGLCRLLSRRGIRVAPFKAQNMALNSYVTAQGDEMGRAQVTQAQAAGIQPHADMNPVLLKPVGEEGSQVILNGKAIGNYGARAYYEMKERMRDAAHEAYDRLSSDFDAIILEGAGSPAEINLMEEDFVNMDMAHYANAQTILVADIDRGGVFASALGTIELLRPEHRRLLAGVVINKFRGDPSLLTSGLQDLEEMTGVPVLGVLPYLRELRIDEEDSLGLDKERATASAVLDIAVVRLPRISNFTDFAAMECDTGVSIRYVETPCQLGNPHLIIIPGSKNTRADLDWLHEGGLGKAILSAQEEGTPVFGICGGYQMLGSSVDDPLGVEGPQGETDGLSLLEITTTLTSEKELFQVNGIITPQAPFAKAELPFRGYEIHAGRTEIAAEAARPLRITRRGEALTTIDCGATNTDGSVFGCYIHGIFDALEARSALYAWLCRIHSIDEDTVEPSSGDPIAEFDRVADMLEECLDLRALLEYCGAEPESA